MLAESAGRAQGSVMNEMKFCSDLGFSTFSKLHDSRIGSILFYAAGGQGFKEGPDSYAIQSQATRYFFGVHKYTAKWAIEEDVGWDSCLIKPKPELVRL